jgi:hypothetical protein
MKYVLTWHERPAASAADYEARAGARTRCFSELENAGEPDDPSVWFEWANTAAIWLKPELRVRVRHLAGGDTLRHASVRGLAERCGNAAG